MLQIQSREQLVYIVYVALKQYDECVIEIKNKNNSLFVISSKMPNNKVLLSLCANSKSIGDIADNCDDEKMNWVKDNLQFEVTEDIYVNIVDKKDEISKIDIDDIDLDNEFEYNNIDPNGYYDIEDYREDYLTKHNRMRMTQEPIGVRNADEAMRLFKQFLVRDDCDKLIFTFYTRIPDLDHIFIIDLVLDKLYVYGRTLISFIVTRPDMGDIEFTNPSDCVTEYLYKNIENNRELLEIFYGKINVCYTRCDLVSNHQKVRINAYSNCKLNMK